MSPATDAIEPKAAFEGVVVSLTQAARARVRPRLPTTAPRLTSCARFLFALHREAQVPAVHQNLSHPVRAAVRWA